MIESRVCKAITTLGQMLEDRGDVGNKLLQLTEDEIVSKLDESVVRFDTGTCDVILFTYKLNSTDLAKAAANTSEQRRMQCILVTMEPLISVHTKAVSTHFGLEVETFVLPFLVLNVSRHFLVPKHEVVERQDVAAIFSKLSLTSMSQLPCIESRDPMAKYIRARPGDLVRVTRLCPTAGTQVAYRYCKR